MREGRVPSSPRYTKSVGTRYQYLPVDNTNVLYLHKSNIWTDLPPDDLPWKVPRLPRSPPPKSALSGLR